MVCKLTGIVGKAIDSNRKCLEFSSYAKINIPNAWQKITNNQRNPFKYIETNKLLKDLEINISELSWLNFS